MMRYTPRGERCALAPWGVRADSVANLPALQRKQRHPEHLDEDQLGESDATRIAALAGLSEHR